MKKHCTRRTLGKGGMGVVDLVTDLDSGEQWTEKYALNGNREYERYLFHEADVLGKLEGNKHVPKCLGVHNKNGQHYLKQEYIVGDVLADNLENKISQYDKNMFSSLAYLGRAILTLEHQRIIHRDIKPENIILSPQIHLIDFGIALDLEKGEFQGIRSRIFGTPIYMSPEQTRGEQLSFASDYFAYSTIVFEALTGDSILPLAAHKSEYMNGVGEYNSEIAEENMRSLILDHGYNESLASAWLACAMPAAKDRKIVPLLEELEKRSLYLHKQQAHVENIDSKMLQELASTPGVMEYMTGEMLAEILAKEK